MMQVEWRRNLRARHVGLRIDPCLGRVIVTLPRHGTRRAGLALLDAHAVWVAERLAALPPNIAFAEAAVIRLDGRPIRIRHAAGAETGARRLGGELLVSGPSEQLATQVFDFLHEQARMRLAALVARKAARAGVQPRRIVLKDMRSRWASCAVDRTLTFSWRLVMAPRYVQDYVVAHEVAHLRHMNHGEQFRLLERGLSHFGAQARVWLQRHGVGLLRVGAAPMWGEIPR